MQPIRFLCCGEPGVPVLLLRYLWEGAGAVPDFFWQGGGGPGRKVAGKILATESRVSCIKDSFID
jgi:hypothetical protein